MRRPLWIEFPGMLYPVTARGNLRREIVRDDQDREAFLVKLEEAVEVYHRRLYAFVLMGNHYHLMLCTPRANLSAAMHQFQSSYSTYFRARHHLSGHVFGGRFKSPLVEGDRYLLRLTRYVHLNPVKIRAVQGLPVAERMALLKGYRWSSYPGYTQRHRRLRWVDYGPLSAPQDVAHAVADVLGRRVGELPWGRGNSSERDALILAWRDLSGRSNREIGHRLGHADGATVGKRLKTLRSNGRRWQDLQRLLQEVRQVIQVDPIANYKA